MPQPVAGPVDPEPGQILTGRHAEQSADSLIELERRKPGAPRELGNAQGLVEMVVNIAKRR